MRIRIHNELRDHGQAVLATKRSRDSVNGMTVEEVLLSLNTLMAVGSTGGWRLTAVTKNVRGIFRLFEPEDHSVMM